jgi:DEAD/DEAH box helicase domain-containing protein
MSETLSLLFPELPLAPVKGDLTAVLNKFERMAQNANGPIRAIRRTPARRAEYADYPEDLSLRLREVLTRRGIERLYTHQAEACQRIAAGSNVVVVTPTCRS